jgi:hypothetical protein
VQERRVRGGSTGQRRRQKIGAGLFDGTMDSLESMVNRKLGNTEELAHASFFLVGIGKRGS